MEQTQGFDHLQIWIATQGSYDYDLWTLVAVNSLVFIAFAQWPTLLTLAMFPVLLVMYARLARREEAEMKVASARITHDTPPVLPRSSRAGGAHLGCRPARYCLWKTRGNNDEMSDFL